MSRFTFFTSNYGSSHQSNKSHLLVEIRREFHRFDELLLTVGEAKVRTRRRSLLHQQSTHNTHAKETTNACHSMNRFQLKRMRTVGIKTILRSCVNLWQIGTISFHLSISFDCTFSDHSVIGSDSLLRQLFHFQSFKSSCLEELGFLPSAARFTSRCCPSPTRITTWRNSLNPVVALRSS